jgi:hypothetical protein
MNALLLSLQRRCASLEATALAAPMVAPDDGWWHYDPSDCTCSICLGKISPSASFLLTHLVPCRHIFHTWCWYQFLVHRDPSSPPTCPICRSPVEGNSPVQIPPPTFFESQWVDNRTHQVVDDPASRAASRLLLYFNEKKIKEEFLWIMRNIKIKRHNRQKPITQYYYIDNSGERYIQISHRGPGHCLIVFSPSVHSQYMHSTRYMIEFMLTGESMDESSSEFTLSIVMTFYNDRGAARCFCGYLPSGTYFKWPLYFDKGRCKIRL